MKKMRKSVVWMIAAILFCGTSVSAQAQSTSDDIKHEVGVSYGGGSVSTWASIGRAIGDALFSGLNVRYENSSWFGSLSAEYFYHVDDGVGIGAIGCFSQDNDDLLIDNTKQGDRTTQFITLMPALKYEYLRKKHFGMYFKAAAGYTLKRVNEVYKSEDKTKTDGMFNFQISLLGMEAGSQHLRGFIEAGFGEQGIILAGLRCKF